MAGIGPPARAAPERCDRSPILVRGARIWTPQGRTAPRDIMFEDDRVSAIGRAGSIGAKPGARIVDGRGQTLLPGLIDLHLHMGVAGGLPDSGSASPSRHWAISGRQLLRSGVTSGRIHLTSLEAGARLRTAAEDPCAALPRVQIGSPGVGGGIPDTEGPAFTGVRNPEDAAAKAERFAAAGAQWIAIHEADKFLPGELPALTAAARGKGLRIMGGATSAAELEAVLATRPDTIDYVDLSDAAFYPDALLRRLKRLPGIVLVPTIGHHYRLNAFAADPALVEAPSNFEYMSEEDGAFVRDAARGALASGPYVATSRAAFPRIEGKFRQLLASGIPMATGTDVGSEAHFHAGGIWWELEAWRAFGASPRRALTAATVTGARVLRDARAGTLAIGSHADFLLYAGDVEDGRFELARVRTVAKGNVLFVRDGYWVGP